MKLRSLRRGLEARGKHGSLGTLDLHVLQKAMRHSNGGDPIQNGVWWVKLLGGILATETVLHRRGQSVDTAGAQGNVCKLCEATAESNWHMLGQCCGEPLVVNARREMVAGIKQVVKGYLGDSATAQAVDELWQLTPEGAIQPWHEDPDLDAVGVDASSAEEEAQVALRLSHAARDLVDLMDTQGELDMFIHGCTHVGWRRYLVRHGGITLAEATAMTSKLHKLVRAATGKGITGAKHGTT